MDWLIYARVSTDEQAQEGISLDAQVASCRAYATARGWIIGDGAVVIDGGISAATLKRPGIQRVMAGLRAGKGVIAWKLDRLTRSLRDLLDLVAIAGDRGGLVSVTEQLDTTTPMGRFTCHLLGALAQWEREMTGQRTRAAVEHARREGRFTGGHLPVGLRVVDEDGKRKVALGDDAATVAQVWGQILRGDSLLDVARFLGAAGLPGRWSTARVRSLLLSPRAVGLLVDRGTQEAVRMALAARPGYAGRPSGSGGGGDASPLSGVARCALCLATLHHVSATGHGGTYRYLRCTGRVKGVCAAKDPRAEPIEREVAAAVSKAFTDGEYAQAMRDMLAAEGVKADEARGRKAKLLGEREQLRARSDELALHGPRPSDPAFWQAMRPMAERLAAIESELAAVEGQLAAGSVQGASAETVLAGLAAEGADIGSAPPERQRAVYDAVLSYAIVHEDRVELGFWDPRETTHPLDAQGVVRAKSRSWLLG